MDSTARSPASAMLSAGYEANNRSPETSGFDFAKEDALTPPSEWPPTAQDVISGCRSIAAAGLADVQQGDAQGYFQDDHQITRVRERAKDVLIGARINPCPWVKDESRAGLSFRGEGDGGGVLGGGPRGLAVRTAGLVGERVEPRQPRNETQDGQPAREAADQLPA